MIGSRTPRSSRKRDCATFGAGAGHVSSPASSSSVPKSARCCACHAAIASLRKRLRGEWYSPSASRPPWQRRPAITSGSSPGCSASSSSSVQRTCRFVCRSLISTSASRRRPSPVHRRGYTRRYTSGNHDRHGDVPTAVRPPRAGRPAPRDPRRRRIRVRRPRASPPPRWRRSRRRRASRS